MKAALTNRITAGQVRLIHVARRQLGLSDDSYRAVLEGATGKRSSRDLNGADVERVLVAFAQLGFKSASARVKAARAGSRRWATDAQLVLLKKLWLEAAEYPNDAGLAQFLQHHYGVSRPGDLTFGDAARAIEALKAMAARRTAPLKEAVICP